MDDYGIITYKAPVNGLLEEKIGVLPIEQYVGPGRPVGPGAPAGPVQALYINRLSSTPRSTYPVFLATPSPSLPE